MRRSTRCHHETRVSTFNCVKKKAGKPRARPILGWPGRNVLLRSNAAALTRVPGHPRVDQSSEHT